MGGIKQHGKGIQITFYWNGKRYRPTLRIEPTATNLKYANRLKGEIEVGRWGKSDSEKTRKHPTKPRKY
ncbi:Arm DNA-binding domain-containing protein [Candidatus Ferrigenium straubiae]|jgi:hypothetical protein|uniref:Arm DNA-binding domain-containing protein n=1 Tax=Candidatus Ferrigenium straubiae TaxID=2919506 RepID=UPI003F4ADCD0